MLGDYMDKRNLMVLILTLIIFVSGCTVQESEVVDEINASEIPILGGDINEHGCIGSAGYVWCESKQKCLRVWEEGCPDDEIITTFDECIEAGYPIMESYPRQCNADGQIFLETLESEYEHLSLEDAIVIANQSECVSEGNLLEVTASYNEHTNTWWIDLDINKQGCYPACVVSEETLTAEINWRCTGALIEQTP